MTIKEAQYFKKYIDERLNELLGAMTQQQLNTLQGQRFAARFLSNVEGQQMLPQSVFRQFLDEIDYSEAKQLHDDLVVAKEDLEQALENADNVSDMESLHYTDVAGDTAPLYIYIDEDAYELAGVDTNDETALWSGISTVLDARKTDSVQIVDLNVRHRGLQACTYLYFSTNKVRSNRRMTYEYLWSAEGYYKRSIAQNGAATEWEWNDAEEGKTLALTAQATADAAQKTADTALEKCGSLNEDIFRLSEDGKLWLKSDISFGGTAEQPDTESVRNTLGLYWDNIGLAKDAAGNAQSTANTALSTAKNALQAAYNHEHSDISSGSTAVECDGSNVIIKDSQGNGVFKTLNKYSEDEYGVEFRTEKGNSIGTVTNKRISFHSNNVQGLKIDSDIVTLALSYKSKITATEDAVQLDNYNCRLLLSDNEGYVSLKRDETHYLTIDDIVAKIRSDEFKLSVNSTDENVVDAVKVTYDETTIKNVASGSMGLRLKETQSELKCSGKGLTTTGKETKLTATDKVALIADSIELKDNNGYPIISTKYGETGLQIDTKATTLFMGDYNGKTEGFVNLILNGGDVNGLFQQINNSQLSDEIVIQDIGSLATDKKILSKEFMELVYNGMMNYEGATEYHDEGAYIFKRLSTAKLRCVIDSKFWFDNKQTLSHRYHHLRPWSVEFWDEFTQFGIDGGGVSIPVIRIIFQEDTTQLLQYVCGIDAKYLDYEYRSEKWIYKNAGGDPVGEFSIY